MKSYDLMMYRMYNVYIQSKLDKKKNLPPHMKIFKNDVLSFRKSKIMGAFNKLKALNPRGSNITIMREAIYLFNFYSQSCK